MSRRWFLSCIGGLMSMGKKTFGISPAASASRPTCEDEPYAPRDAIIINLASLSPDMPIPDVYGEYGRSWMTGHAAIETVISVAK